MSPFDRVHATSYSTLVETMRLSRTVSTYMYASTCISCRRVTVCLSVRHTPVLYRNECTGRADFLHTSFPRTMLRCVLGKLGISKNKVLPSGCLSQTLDSENVATAHRRQASANCYTADGLVFMAHLAATGKGPTADVHDSDTYGIRLIGLRHFF